MTLRYAVLTSPTFRALPATKRWARSADSFPVTPQPAGRPAVPAKVEWIASEFHKTHLTGGYCSSHLTAEACPYANGCETCDKFVPSHEFAPALRAELDDIRALKDDAERRCWTGKAVTNALSTLSTDTYDGSTSTARLKPCLDRARWPVNRVDVRHRPAASEGHQGTGLPGRRVGDGVQAHRGPPRPGGARSTPRTRRARPGRRNLPRGAADRERRSGLGSRRIICGKARSTGLDHPSSASRSTRRCAPCRAAIHTHSLCFGVEPFVASRVHTLGPFFPEMLPLPEGRPTPAETRAHGISTASAVLRSLGDLPWSIAFSNGARRPT